MEQTEYDLEIKKEWKVYQVIAVTIVICCSAFIAYSVYEFREYMGTASIFLVSFMILISMGALYSMLYSFKHKIVFKDDRMVRFGIFNRKEIIYDNISQILFSHSYWKISPTFRLIGDNKAIHIDFKYDREEKETIAEFLTSKFEQDSGPEIVKI